MNDTQRISKYLVALRIGKHKYQSVVDFQCKTNAQWIEIGKFIGQLRLKQHKKKGFYPVYSKSSERPHKNYPWKKLPAGVTIGAQM